ncbi:hypothetical protein TPHA_0G01660 [Tetrapisispora phaffii CBS 4417]|uniref:Uncharacterized protein n=1 Tax=Tetrapisispora phaffii (strain ATCC 24235 / CBS 4417 / NBRC 1672 / NRRL Y-8282 / UCD 70-5) TaxID=1071381 RepID=G8BVS4_TETPH|nr:hypothetical protein TPHA_0G01660 [Tetrapisispora phaffii CBS 4417]CCE64002.1 hypothetical protein TPHA_0G01660 [Tetrapisispora phaffii CBS 4417]
MNVAIKSSKNKVVGIGTDILYLPRLTNILDKHALALSNNIKLTSSTNERYNSLSSLSKICNKFMHKNEIDHLNEMLVGTQQNTPNFKTNAIHNYIGGIWAIKESTYKAISQHKHTFSEKIPLPPAQTIYTKLLYKTNTSNSNGLPQLHIDTNFGGSSNVTDQIFYNKLLNPKDYEILISLSHDTNYVVAYTCILAKGSTS